MMGYFGNYFFSNNMMSFGGPWFFGMGIWILAWTLAWKGWALWKAAQKGDKVWFIVLMVLNTFAILDILYIFVLSETKLSSKNEIKKTNKTKKK